MVAQVIPQFCGLNHVKEQQEGHVPAVARVPELVTQLYQIVAELERTFPDRKFTPDGHLVGSIGEVIAAHRYGLSLLSSSEKAHDAKDKTGRMVQIKVTQGASVALRAEPAFLIVLKLLPTGETSEVYNGPGHEPWIQAGKLQSNGQRPISLYKLVKLHAQVSEHERITPVAV